MANSGISLALFMAFILVVAASEVLVAEGRTCQRRSRTYVGNCLTNDCNFSCLREGGISGLCGADFASGVFACFCQFYC